MKMTTHRNGNVSLHLTPKEVAEVWSLIREGRRVHTKMDVNYDSSLAIDLLQKLYPNSNYVSPNYVNEHIRKFDRSGAYADDCKNV